MPKLVIINKSTGVGGAAIAASRLFKAHKLFLSNWEVHFLAQEGETRGDKNIHILSRGRISRFLSLFRLALEKLLFLYYERSREIRFQFSIANTGRNLSGNPVLKKADIIHLHWLYQGFLSIRGMDRIFSGGKPVVWTLHDMWTFTGGCHYTGDCDHYLHSCGDCPFLRKGSSRDLSNRIFTRKMELFRKHPGIVFVSCSEWLARTARASSILKKHRIEVIPNTLDIELFAPGDKKSARQKLGIESEKFIILFGAAYVNDKRKGFSYLLASLDKIKAEYPDEAENIELMFFGKAGSTVPAGYRIYDQKIVTSEKELVNIYRAADVFVLPSLEDNLPNTIMESMACGTPVVAFNSGGIPEMIDHHVNGYLAESKNTEELVKGILWIKSGKNEYIGKSAREKVLHSFHPEKISKAYKELYLSLIK